MQQHVAQVMLNVSNMCIDAQKGGRTQFLRPIENLLRSKKP